MEGDFVRRISKKRKLEYAVLRTAFADTQKGDLSLLLFFLLFR